MMFKVGDIVEAVRDNLGIKTGESVRVIGRTSNGAIGVETASYSGGHSCLGLGRTGHCWWVIPDDFTTVNISLENK